MVDRNNLVEVEDLHNHLVVEVDTRKEAKGKERLSVSINQSIILNLFIFNHSHILVEVVLLVVVLRNSFGLTLLLLFVNSYLFYSQSMMIVEGKLKKETSWTCTFYPRIHSYYLHACAKVTVHFTPRTS